jgi:hypothetical protein
MLGAVALFAAATASGVASAADAAPPPDPAVARCILQNLDRARGWTSAELVRQACEGLVGPNARTEDSGAGYLVECRVSSDPEWIEFRLVTRSQCDQANGVSSQR